VYRPESPACLAVLRKERVTAGVLCGADDERAPGVTVEGRPEFIQDAGRRRAVVAPRLGLDRVAPSVHRLPFGPPKGSSARYRVGVRSEEVRRPSVRGLATP